MDTNKSLNLRVHKMEAKPSEENSIARCYVWTKAGRAKAAKDFPREVTAWKENAPLARVMMTFSTEELVKLHRESRKNGMVKVSVALWDSKFPKTSDGWSAEAPAVDEYVKPKEVPQVVDDSDQDEVLF